MVSEASQARLGDCAEILTGFPFKSDEYVADGHRLLRGDNIVQGSLRWEGAKFLRSGKQVPDQYRVHLNDIVLAMDRPWIEAGLKVARIGPGDAGALLVQRVSRLRAKCDVDPTFLYCVLRSEAFTAYILGVQTGTAVPHISKNQISSFKVLLPALNQQRAVGELMARLDERVTGLHITNQILERLLRAIFKSWFVDFDAVRAKAEGREPEGMDAATAVLFPATFDGAGIPSGWSFLKASEMMQISRRSINPLKHSDQLFKHYSLPAFDEGRRPKAEFGRDIKSNKTIMTSGSILLSKLNPHIPRIWLPDIRAGDMAISSTEFVSFVPVAPLSSEYLYCHFSEDGFVKKMGSLTTGTSNSHQRINVDALLAQKLIHPPRPVLEAFDSLAVPLFTRVKLNIGMQETLASLRDTLLPSLISGKLRLPEAEEMVEGAL